MKLKKEMLLQHVAGKVSDTSYSVLVALVHAYKPALQAVLSQKGGEDERLPFVELDHEKIREAFAIRPKDYTATLRELRNVGYITRIRPRGKPPLWRVNLDKIAEEADGVAS